MKITQSEKSLVEHYVYATAASAVAIWQTGNHNFKHVIWAALIGVIGPVLKGTYTHFQAPAGK